MDYRLAQYDDLDEICNLIKKAIIEMECHEIYQWDECYPSRENFESDIKEKTLHLVFEKDRFAAVYVINKECEEEYDECTWKGRDEDSYIMHRLCVSPDFQHKGIGKEVLLHIEEQVKEMGGNSIRLDVFSENPFALHLYEKNGYERRGQAEWRMRKFFLMEKIIG